VEIKPKILFAQVMHKRLFPKVNAFRYGIYYLVLPLTKLSADLENAYFKLNRRGLLSFNNEDHGNRNSESLSEWARNILNNFGIDKADGEIILVTMPRVCGYVFNPVSFWYCLDKSQKLRAVICEVNNTFGETHSYICVHDDQREITNSDYLTGQKLFHVSPFLEREGHYKFRFSLGAEKMGAWIDFYDGEGKKKLLTALTGDFSDFTPKNCAKAFWRYPLITIKSIFLIHWQALKLFLLGTEYVPKPIQNKERVSGVNSMKDKN